MSRWRFEVGRRRAAGRGHAPVGADTRGAAGGRARGRSTDTATRGLGPGARRVAPSRSAPHAADWRRPDDGRHGPRPGRRPRTGPLVGRRGLRRRSPADRAHRDGDAARAVRSGARARRGRVARRVRERPHVAAGPGARRTVQDPLQPRSAHQRLQARLRVALAGRRSPRPRPQHRRLGARTSWPDRSSVTTPASSRATATWRSSATTRAAAGPVAARVTVRPRGAARRSGAWSDVEVGVSATGGDVAEGRYSLRGRTASRDVFFSPVFVKGRRLRVGGDLDWRPGPFGFRAEYLRADDARHHQGLMGETLPPAARPGLVRVGRVGGGGAPRARGGRRSAGVGGSRRPRADGAGRAPVVRRGRRRPTARSAHRERPASPTVDDQVWTIGANWTFNRLVRLQLNAVREQVTDRARGAASIPSRGVESGVPRAIRDVEGRRHATLPYRARS